MKFGVYASNVGELADVRVLADMAVQAEETGFDGFFIPDWMLPSSWPGGEATAVADVQVH